MNSNLVNGGWGLGWWNMHIFDELVFMVPGLCSPLLMEKRTFAHPCYKTCYKQQNIKYTMQINNIRSFEVYLFISDPFRAIRDILASI